MKKTHGLYLCTALVCSLTGLSGAAAQTTATSGTPAADGELQDIIVTAEKRPSVVQRTPLAITVVTSEELERNGVNDVGDLAGLAPSLNFGQGGGTSVLAIRGISSRDTTEVGDPAVSISFDGIYFQRTFTLNAAIFDLERVEVLRGPQGTLLGRNATGGAVNIITAKPTHEFGAYATAEYGNYDMFNTTGAVNLPITDWLAVRAAFQTRDRNGYRENAPARDGDDEGSKSARLSALLSPNDALSVTLIGEYTRYDSVGPVIQRVAPTLVNGVANLNARPSIPNNGKEFPITPGGFYKGDVYFARWNVSYNFGPVMFTYLGGFRHADVRRLGNFGGLYNSIRRNWNWDQFEHPETINHEVRLASNTNGRFHWQVGGFYFKETNPLLTTIEDFPNSASLTTTPVTLNFYDYPHVLSQAKALFGQAGFKLTDTIEVEGGIRYSDDKKERSGYSLTTNTNTYFATGAVSYVRAPDLNSFSGDVTTYHAGVNWQFTPVNLLYAKYDTGFKDGGFTSFGPYGPEQITSYEIGSKNRFLDNTLQVNASAYYYDYTDQQVQQTRTLPSGAVDVVVLNAGKSRFKGFDVEVDWRLTPTDRLNGFVAYNHAEYTDFSTPVNNVNVQLAGNQPPQAPRWSANIGYSHDFDIGPGDITFRAQTHIESKSYFTIFNRASDRQDAYTRSDLNLSYTPKDKTFTIESFVKNVEDTRIFTNASASALYYSYQYAPPRTYGLRGRVNFR